MFIVLLFLLISYYTPKKWHCKQTTSIGFTIRCAPRYWGKTISVPMPMNRGNGDKLSNKAVKSSLYRKHCTTEHSPFSIDICKRKN
ncbi:hypothetical protein HQ45_05780 [Porphyromonas crevioricanis]|uniref:Uncharacterized protein n=1 Tax=Porphyromonas crevioricanis JCM 15906 TaxID=1305617 RepID=S4PGP3_9PORP|nr:hypothetical protein HQ45_05780 [Porphyromonas crevioricanis]GAD04836.1 hypothetical protein PORCRE_532 [Porphyromonas crevioricanis JCM 15906]